MIDFKQPEQLSSEIDFEIGDEPYEKDDLIKQCKLILENQVKPYHPHFHNQLFGGFD